MMATEWFYNVDGKKNGPHSSAQLQALAKSGKLKPTDKVWKEGMAKWVSASTVKGLFPSAGEAVKPNTGNAQSKTRPSPEKGKKSRASDKEQEAPKQGGGRGKVIALGAVVVLVLVACLGGAIVVGGWYLNSGTPEKILAENKEKAPAGQVDKEKKEPPSEQPKDGGTEKKEPPSEQPKDGGTEKKEPPTEQPKDGGTEKKEPPTEQPKDKTAEIKEAPTGQIGEENKKEALSDIPSPQRAFQIASLPGPVLGLSFSPDGKQLTCVREFLLKTNIIITTVTTVTSWDASSGKEIWAFPPPTGISTPYRLAYSPNGPVVSGYKGISVLDAKTGGLIK